MEKLTRAGNWKGGYTFLYFRCEVQCSGKIKLDTEGVEIGHGNVVF